MMQNDWIGGKRDAYRQALEDALARIRHRLADIPEVRKAILFGSSARGRRDLFTDWTWWWSCSPVRISSSAAQSCADASRRGSTSIFWYTRRMNSSVWRSTVFLRMRLRPAR